MLSLTPFFFALFACMVDPEQDSNADQSGNSLDNSGNENNSTDSDGDGLTGNEDCDDENPWVSEDCRRTCTGDFEILSDDDLPQVAGCSVINGSLDIEGLTQTDLLALNQLENVTGSLLIMNNEALESTTGLDNLTNVGEDLLISFNDALMNLNGLDSVQSVGNTLSLSNSSSLSNIQGLSGLASVGSSILLNNIPIADLKGFENLQIIGSSLYISDCTEITSLIDIASNLISFGENDTIGTYDEEGYIIESLFYVYSNDQLCEDVVAQTTVRFENMGWEGRSISFNNNGSCD